MSVIERSNATPLYVQLKNKLKKDIRAGVLRAGDKIPSEAQLQKEYGMSRVTVRNAMEELASEGYIIKVQGKGSFVAQTERLRLPIGITSFSEDAAMQGMKLTSKVIKIGIEEIESEFDKTYFDDKTDGKVLVLKRVRSVGGVPLAIEENHLIPNLPGIEEENLTESLYRILIEKYHIVPANKGRRSIRIIFADREMAEQLDISQGTPVIESEMCVFDTNGEPIHTVKDIVRGDNDRFIKWYV